MKLRRLSAAALVAIIGAVIALPAVASASTGSQVDAKGYVEVKGGELKPDDPKPDPEKPGEDLDPNEPEYPSNPTPGNLGIQNVSVLRFGEIKTGGADITTPAAVVPMETTAADGTVTTKPRGQMIQFGDARGTRAGYTVTATMSQFTNAAGTETLDGSTISYSSGIITNEANVTMPTYFNSAFTLEDGVTNTIVGALAGEGSGTFVLEYGQSDDYDPNAEGVAQGGNAGTAATANTLFVPSKTASSMLVDSYTATIVWTVDATPYVPAP